MPFKHCVFTLLAIVLCLPTHAQDKKIRASLKADVLNFRNQATRMKEYKAEQKKKVELATKYGGPVKIVIEIDADTTIEDDEAWDPADNIITGYIKEETPTESIIAYELHFDRTAKKIFEVVSDTDSPGDKLNKKDEDK
ncbi:MAG: hypothetical protein P4L41_16300 [Flavipsychrobacter sp.]|nr:hypothetical protein [Flavipsychrobacter sp.]